MAHFKYLLVGGGMAADAAVRGIRKNDPHGSIGLFSIDEDPPYTRPLLSKGLWKGKPFEQVWRGTEKKGADIHLGCAIQSVDLPGRMVLDQRKQSHSFEKLLLATGGTPRQIPGTDGEIIYYRTLDDYRRLHNLAQSGQRFAVIGGGFIGSEIAAALAMNGKEVSMFFPEEGIGKHVYPLDLSQYLNEYYQKHGVAVFPGEKFNSLEKNGQQYIVKTDGGRQFLVDGVIAGLGIRPNVELAQAAGLEVENGVLVDEFLCTGHPEVYAAGDVASFYNPALGKRMRVEHEDNALSMGELAGLNMSGEPSPYHHLPFFYSDLFDLGYEAVGELDSRLEIIIDWQEPFKKGVLYYMRDGRVRGVLLWNVWGQVDAARRLIADPGPFKAADLKGRLHD